MKNKTLKLMLMALGLMLVSCGKTQKTEWNHYYGYTNTDIVGTYRFSNLPDAFDALTEGEYCHLCKDAEITISHYSGSSIEFKVNCSNEGYNQTFTGDPSHNEDDFLINMTNGHSTSNTEYSVSASVYDNSKGEIRLHGYARKTIYGVDSNQHQYVRESYNYYFDVIKN